MIGTKQLSVTAGRPNFPLGTLYVRTGSAANVALLDVPVRGGVNVTAVTVRVTNADGAGADFPAVRGGNIWVVDLPASHFSTPGRVDGGVEVWASGTGADNAAHSWNIGVGDLCVLDADAAQPVPGEAWATLRLLDAAPTTANKGDCYFSGDALLVYDGTAWVEIGGGGETPIAPSTDPSAAGKPADAKATGDRLAGKLSTGGGTMTGTIGFTPSDIGPDGYPLLNLSNTGEGWQMTFGVDDYHGQPYIRHNGSDTGSGIGQPEWTIWFPDASGTVALAADLRYRIAEAGYATTGAKLPDGVTVISQETPSGDVELLYSNGGGEIRWNLYIGGEFVGVFWPEDGVGADGTGLIACTFYLNGVEMESPPNLLVPRALADRKENHITPTGSVATIDIELPDVIGGEPAADRPARDFFLDIDNSVNTNDLALEFTALGTDYAFVAEKGESIGDMMTIAGESAQGEGDGEKVRLYFNESALSMGGMPVIHVARVTLGDFVTSTTPAQGGN